MTYLRIRLAAAAVLSVVACDAAMAHPIRGSVHWSVLLCKYSDSGNPPKTVDFYTDMFQNYSKMDWSKVREVAMTFEPGIRREWPDYLEEMNGERCAMIDSTLV